MTPLTYFEHRAVVNNRADITVLLCGLGKAQQAVEVGQNVGVNLNLRNKLLHSQHQFVEQLGLQGQYLILCPKYLFFIFLQLLRNVTLSLSQRLLAHPLLRH